MKKLLSFCFLAVTLLFTGSASLAASPGISYEIHTDGSLLSVPENMGKVFADTSNRLQIPIRALAEGLKCSVEWEPAERRITITKPDGGRIEMTVGSKSIETGKGAIIMDTTPVLLNGRTYIPVRSAAEALGYSVGYSAYGSIGRVDIKSMDKNGNPVFTPKYSDIAEALADIRLYPLNDGNYKPESPLTRASCAKLLVKLTGNEEDVITRPPWIRQNFPKGFQHPFTDVLDGDSQYVGFLYHYGVIKGETGTRLGSDKPVAMNEFANMALMLWGYSESPKEDPLGYMSRLGFINDSEAAYFKGRDSFFCDDAAGIFYAVFNNRGKMEPVSSDKINATAFEDMIYRFRGSEKNSRVEVKTPNTEGNSQENLKNGGNVASQDNYTYFVQNGISRFDMTTGKVERVTNCRAYLLNVIGDRLYFLRDTAGTPLKINYQRGKMYSTRLGGTDLRIVSDDYIKYFYIKDGWIYYINESDAVGQKWSDNEFLENVGYGGNYPDYPEQLWLYGRIYRMRLDGTERTRLTDEGAFNFYLYGDQIYYQDGQHHVYYKANLDGSGKTLLEGDWFRVWDGYGYYYTQSFTDHYIYELHRHINGDQDQTVIPANEKGTSWELIFNGDKLYYREYIYNVHEIIYVANLDGSDRKKLAEVHSAGFNLSGGYLYLNDTVSSVYMRFKPDGTGKEILDGDKWVSAE